MKKKTQRTAKVGLVFSASLCQIPPVLMHQPKMLVLPPRITDENRDTERLSILPQLTQLLRAGLRTGPLWSNLESRCCDDPEGAAETRWPMLSEACAHTHTRARGLHLRGYRSQRKPECNRERPKDSRGQSGGEATLPRRPGNLLPWWVCLNP